ncbi:MAG: T9SS type A sorting domain-containing protein [Bacteroidales bacterium]|nr:T9SS type A sorting domain-containing protein [Bacteroidales bacterium]
MKKFFYILIILVISISNGYSQLNDTIQSCQGSSIIWPIVIASPTDICIIKDDNNNFDTIHGNTVELAPNTTTTYDLVSINGSAPMLTMSRTIIVNIPPTFTVDSIHSPTCPYPYLGPGSPDSPNSGPWADGSFSVILNDSVQNYESIKVRSDSSFFFVRTFHDSFTTGGLRGGTYNIIARGTNGCEVTQQVTIQQPPAWGYSTWEWKNVTCNGGSINIEIIGGTPPLSYHWWNALDSNITFPDTTHIHIPDLGIYRLIVTDSFNCNYRNIAYIEITMDTLIATDSVFLKNRNINTLLSDSITICNQSSVNIDGWARGHGTYQWNTGDTSRFIEGSIDSNLDYLAVEFTDQNGCTTTDTVYLDFKEIQISITADSIMNDDSVYTVTVSPLGGTLYLDGIEIPIGNGTISFDASQYQLGEHSFFYSGEWGDFGCYFDTTFQFTIQHQDGVSEFERATKLWPNPASNILNIEFSGEFSGDILLFDMTGRLLKTTEKESEITSIDVSDLTSGVYFIHFVSQNGTFTKKFVKK